MAQNRLLELQKYGTFEDEEGGDVVIDVPQQAFSFEKDIAEIKEGMAAIRKNFRLIRECFNKQLSSSGSGGKHDSGDDVEELLTNTNGIANKIRYKLKALKDLQEKLNPEDPGKRMLYNTHGPLTKKFIDLMNEYQSLQTGFKEKFRNRVYRQAEIVMPGISQNEVDRMIDSGDSERMFADRILNDQKHSEARNALMLMQEQQRDLMHLEKSIAELNSLFLDVTTMLDTQGDALNAIAKATSAASDKTAKSLKSLEKAESLVRKRRKKCIIVVSAIAGVLLVIFALIAAMAMS